MSAWRSGLRAVLPLLCVALLGTAPAGATSAFPAAIQDELGLTVTPGCTLCHMAATGGLNATKPFALSMRAAGLVPFNLASLTAALAQLEADGADSDGDGVGDIDELLAGSDPNQPDAAGEGEGEGEAGLAPIQYGFGCAGTTPASPALLFGLVLLARSVRRWRPAPCPRR